MVAGALDTILIPSLRMEEILSDGSTLSNPAADSRRLFLGEDGLLHLRDSAGTVTDIASGGVTPTTQGTTSAGASFATRGMYLKKITLATPGNVAAIHAFIKGNGTNNIICAPVVYSDAAGAPTTLLYAPATVITDTPVLAFPMRLNTTVRDFRMPGPGQMAAADYWFGIWMSDSTGSASSLANTATGGTGATVAGGTQNQPMDSSLQAITTNSVDYSIYIDVLR